jgi:hypothetical protein
VLPVLDREAVIRFPKAPYPRLVVQHSKHPMYGKHDEKRPDPLGILDRLDLRHWLPFRQCRKTARSVPTLLWATLLALTLLPLMFTGFLMWYAQQAHLLQWEHEQFVCRQGGQWDAVEGRCVCFPRFTGRLCTLQLKSWALVHEPTGYCLQHPALTYEWGTVLDAPMAISLAPCRDTAKDVAWAWTQSGEIVSVWLDAVLVIQHGPIASDDLGRFWLEPMHGARSSELTGSRRWMLDRDGHLLPADESGPASSGPWRLASHL